MKKLITFFTLVFILSISIYANAQLVLFDFDNAPLYSSLPIYQTTGGITAHLSASGQGYSIQNANAIGFTPPGFSGRIIYPNSIYLSDLYIRFDQTLTDFSVMYCCQELGCDDASTMRVTAYLNGNLVIGLDRWVNNGLQVLDHFQCCRRGGSGFRRNVCRL